VTLTPADIHNVEFKKPPIGKRGYGGEDVDAFLDEAEQELIRLLEENRALHDQMQRGGAPGYPTDRDRELDAELSEMSSRLQHAEIARVRAIEHARSLQAQLENAHSAPPAAPPVPVDDRVLAMAQRTADDHMRDAHHESSELLSEARAQSDRITGDARQQAGRIEGDAQRQHTEAMASLDSKRGAMLDEIDQLGRLAQGYQSALDSHLSQQLQQLDDVTTA
jgi:DivIVA domain-containing protein